MRSYFDPLRSLHLLILLFLPASQVAAQIPAKAELISGQSISGKILSISETGVEFQTAQATRDLPIEELRNLQLEDRSNSPDVAPHEVQLIDGTSFACAQISVADQKLSALLGTQQVEFALPSLMRIRISALSQEQAKAWETISNSAVDSDVAVLIRKTGALTKIEGIVESIDQEVLRFDFDGSIDVPFEKVAGVRFYNGQDKSLPKALCELSDIAGNVFMFTSLSSKGASLAGTLGSGDSLEIPWDRVQKIDYSLANMQYLAEVELVRNSAPQVFNFEGLDLGEADLFGVQVVAARWTPGKTVGPSLSFLGPGEALYRIPEGFSQLQGTVMLKPSGNKFSPVEVDIAAEGKIVWEETLETTNVPKSFSLKVTGGQRLRLRVQSIGAFPTGNVVLWQEPKLTK